MFNRNVLATWLAIVLLVILLEASPSLALSKGRHEKVLLRRHVFKTPFTPGRRDTTLSRKRSITNDLLFSSSSILAPIQLGTPAQEVYVLLDTSSSDLAVFGDSYAGQFHLNTHKDSEAIITSVSSASFQRQLSSTYHTNPSDSQFQNTYGNSESSSYFVAEYGRDTLGFRGLTLVDQPLGVIERGNVSYGPLATGIMGLAFEAASLGLRATPPVQQLVFDNAFKQPVFSFALMRPSPQSEQNSEVNITQPGGIFTMGMLDPDQYQGPIGWSDLVTTIDTDSPDAIPYKWLCLLDGGISINGNLVPGTEGIVVNFDTGSSISRGSKRLIDAILSFTQGGAYADDDDDYFVPCGSGVPPALNMTISMGGVSVAIEPLDLLFKTAHFSSDSGQTYCYSTLTTTDSKEYDLQIGDDILRSLFVAFSFDPPRVGIAEQSLNVHNQGAVPDYAFVTTATLQTSTLSQPQATATVSGVSYRTVAAAKVTSHVPAVGKTSIASGGHYLATVAAPLITVQAQSTPSPQIGPIATQSVAVNDVEQGYQRSPDSVHPSGGDVKLANATSSSSVSFTASAVTSMWTVFVVFGTAIGILALA